MNGLQRVVAKATGLYEVTEYQSEELTRLSSALEHTTSELAMMERRYDELAFLNISDPNGVDQDVIPVAKQKQIIRQLRIMRHENPLAKQAIRLILRFTFGKGISWTAKNPDIAKIVQEITTDPVNQAVIFSHFAMQNRLDEIATDGEKFLGIASTPGVAPYIRLGEIPMEEVDDIIYDPNNRHVPVYYKRIWKERTYDASANQGQGAWKVDPRTKPQIKYYRDYRISDEHLASITGLKIPSSKIDPDIVVMHRMVNPVWTRRGQRGVSELFASREWIRVFKNFVQDRAQINAAANAISYIRKVKGGPAGVAAISGKVGGVDVGAEDDVTSARRLSRPVAGSILDTNEAVDYSTIRADTGAVDARQDAQLLLLSLGAGVATNAPYFGEGGDANLATAQAMELPMVKSYEDWQQFSEENLKQLLFYGIMQAKSYESMTELEDDDRNIAFQFPPIITEDVVKWTTAWAQFSQQIAPGNQVVQLLAIRGALNTLHVPNIESLMEEIKTEQERVAAEKKAMQEAIMNGQGPNPDDPNAEKDGKKPPENGQKAGNGGGTVPLGPDLQRIANGKAPRQPATGPRTKT